MFGDHCPQDDDVDMSMQEIEVTETNGITTTSLSCTSFSTSPPTIRSFLNEHAIIEAKGALFALLTNETTLLSTTPRRSKQLAAAPITTSCQANARHNNPIDHSDRTKMCSWYYEMTTFLKISPGTASRAMSYLDRFMGSSSPHAVTASRLRDEYQLVALTTLFLAIKLYERLDIMPCHVSYLSRGRYTSDEVVEMEMAVLKGMEWRAMSETKLDYAMLILDCILPKLTACEEGEIDGMRDLTSLQIQLSDFYVLYSTTRRSMVALAAVMNAYEVKKSKFAECDREVFRSTFRELLERYDGNEVYKIMTKLCRLVDPSSEHPSSNELLNLPQGTHEVPLNHQPIPKSTSQINSFCEESSLEAFGAALETVEETMNLNTIMSHFLCCGSVPSPDSVMEGDASEKPNGCSGSSSSLERGGPGGIDNVNSFDSRGSVKVKKRKGGEASKPSPTSTIAAMLFGTAV